MHMFNYEDVYQDWVVFLPLIGNFNGHHQYCSIKIVVNDVTILPWITISEANHRFVNFGMSCVGC